MRSLAQMAAIARAEAKMHWRRRGLLVIMIGYAVVVLGAAWIQRAELRDLDLAMDPELARRISNAAVLPAGMIALAVLTMPLPPTIADAIPKDRHIGVRELLDSLPLGAGVYLAGKLLGAWIGVVAGLAGVALLVGLTGWSLFGPFDVDVYLEMWVLGVAPLALFTSGMSVLLAAGQPSRRRAALVGVAFAACYLLVWIVSDETALTPGRWWDTLNPNAWFDVLLTDGTGLLAAHAQRLWWMIAAAALQLGLVWLVVWGWVKRKGWE